MTPASRNHERRFALRTKYFYDEEDLKSFREEYAAMPFYRKPLVAGVLGTGLLLLIWLVRDFGVL